MNGNLTLSRALLLRIAKSLTSPIWSIPEFSVPLITTILTSILLFASQIMEMGEDLGLNSNPSRDDSDEKSSSCENEKDEINGTLIGLSDMMNDEVLKTGILLMTGIADYTKQCFNPSFFFHLINYEIISFCHSTRKKLV